MRGRDYFKKCSPIIKLLVKFSKLFPKRFRSLFLGLFRNKNGYTGFLIRYVLFASLAKKCGKNVTIHPGCYFYNLDSIEVGNNVAFNQMCYIQGSGGIKIGDNVGLAHSVTIESESHRFDDLNECIASQGLILKKVIIEDDVWVGAKATILCGKYLRKSSIIGANSVVTKDVDSYAVVAGCPAKLIRYRGTEHGKW